ncbi:MAG TPA: pyridoxamine 5'-phosphate oxidase family protein [Paraburkholderia sp.]|nr:pyridoxamine 5'-phosphate oxidase family protein [Paraburkholderia sp.]
MKLPDYAALNLLHQTATGTLATHSREPQGFPYPTLLPFAPDARHRPVILVSRLAEHTRNLQHDPRAGFLVAHAPDGNVLEGARGTLLGRFEPVAGKEAPDIARRYLRYHPDAERYLALGDFAFWVMHVERLRYIGGFGAMGWLDGADLDRLDPLPADQEDALLRFFDGHPARAAGVALLGVDRYGADFLRDGARLRCAFDAPQTDDASLRAALTDCIDSETRMR